MNGTWFHRDHCPFFGANPEALLVLEFDLEGPAEREILSVVSGSFFSEVLGYMASRLRWAVGLSARFFADCVSPDDVPIPTGLRPLHFNGDQRFRPCLEEHPGHAMIAIGGNWEDILCATESLRNFLVSNGCPIISVNIGSRQATDRDHTGFFDGTSNLQELGVDEFCRCVFVQPEDDPELQGATYLVFRKYEEDLRMWNTLSPAVQEQLIGRQKESGFFLDGADRWSPATWAHTPPTAHIRRVHPRGDIKDPSSAWQERIYRRSITYQESRKYGTVSAGVLFLAIARDPHAQVERIHNKRLLPQEGEKDYFLDSGYVAPKRSVCYLLPLSVPDFLGTFCHCFDGKQGMEPARRKVVGRRCHG